eukprot:g8351.t1
MFAPRVLLKDFQEHNERIKSEKLASERRHDEQISELKQAIAKVARESAQQIESLEAFVKGPFFSGLERKIQDSEKLAKDTLSDLRRNTEEKFQAVEKSLSSLRDESQHATGRLDGHKSDLKRIGNALSGRLFDLASYKLERERDRINIVFEDDSVLNSSGVEGQNDTLFTAAGGEGDGGGGAGVAGDHPDPDVVASGGLGSVAAGEDEQPPTEMEGDSERPDDHDQSVAPPEAAAAEEAPGADETSPLLKDLKRRKFSSPSLNGNHSLNQTPQLVPQPMHELRTKTKQLEQYRPFTIGNQVAKRVKKVEWMVMDIEHKLSVYETGQPLYSPEFTVNIDPLASPQKLLKRARLVFYPKGNSIVAKPGYCSVFLYFPLDDPANPVDEIVGYDADGNGAVSTFPSGGGGNGAELRGGGPPRNGRNLRTRPVTNLPGSGGDYSSFLPPGHEVGGYNTNPLRFSPGSYVQNLLHPNKSPSRRSATGDDDNGRYGSSALDALLVKNSRPEDVRVGRFHFGGEPRAHFAAVRNSFWFRYRLKVGKTESYEVLDTIYKGVDNFCEVRPEVDKETDSLTISLEFLPEQPENVLKSTVARAVLSGQELLQMSENMFQFPDSKEADPAWERDLKTARGDDEGQSAATKASSQSCLLKQKLKMQMQLELTMKIENESPRPHANLFFPFEKLADKMKDIGDETGVGVAGEHTAHSENPGGAVVEMEEVEGVTETEGKHSAVWVDDDVGNNLFADDLATARGLFVTKTNTILVVERSANPPRVTAFWDDDNDSRADAKVTIATAAGLNHGVAVWNGFLYASSSSTVYRWPYPETSERAAVNDALREIVVKNINADGSGGAPLGHTTRTIVFDDLGYLYVSVGSAGNVDMDSFRSRIRRFPRKYAGEPALTSSGGSQAALSRATAAALSTFPNADPMRSAPTGGWDFAADGEVFADGVRNEVGLAFDAGGTLFGVENSADNLVRADLGGDIHNENPGEELNWFPEVGTSTNANAAATSFFSSVLGNELQRECPTAAGTGTTSAASVPTTFDVDARGRFYGYLYCFTEYKIPAGMDAPSSATRGRVFAWPASFGGTTYSDCWCRANTIPPLVALQAHSAPLGITFLRRTDLEQEGAGVDTNATNGGASYSYSFPLSIFENDAFIGYHGSWNRDVPTGYKVVWQKFDAATNLPRKTPEYTRPAGSSATTSATGTPYSGDEPADLLFHERGPASNAWQWPSGYRPVDVKFDRKGRLLVTNDGTRGSGSNLVMLLYIGGERGLAALSELSSSSASGAGLGERIEDLEAIGP